MLGVPFDSGVSYRPGARFGPQHIRQTSRLLRPYDPSLDVSPFAAQQVADAGDLAVNPFDIDEAITAVEEGAERVLADATRLLTLGGDHTIALPLLRCLARRHGPVAVLHFDAHLDTWDTYFGAPYTHGTPFRRASEEGLIDPERSLHVGHPRAAVRRHRPRGVDPARLRHGGVHRLRPARARRRDRGDARPAGDGPVYVSVDIDVIDPGMAPGTGTPEAGGLTSRELLATLRGLAGCRDWTWSRPTSSRCARRTTTPR